MQAKDFNIDNFIKKLKENPAGDLANLNQAELDIVEQIIIKLFPTRVNEVFDLKQYVKPSSKDNIAKQAQHFFLPAKKISSQSDPDAAKNNIAKQIQNDFLPTKKINLQSSADATVIKQNMR